MADQPGCRNQRPGAGLHAIDRRFNVFMLDLADSKGRKSPMLFVAVWLNMPLIARQYTLNLRTMLVTKDTFECCYLFVTTYPQDIRLSRLSVHPSCADGVD